MAVEPSVVDGIGYDDNTATAPNPGVMSGKKLKILGQTVNKATGNIANQQAGTALLSSSGGTILANSVNTVVVSNSLVTANSLIFLTAANEVGAGTFGGDATAGRGMDVWIESVGSGTFTIGYNPRANLAQDWSVNYFIIN
jgi:hypothetical protein